MDNSTQNDILLHLKKEGKITPFDAWWEYGCYRLSVVISRLRKNYVIQTKMTNGATKRGKPTRYATYIYLGKREDFYKNEKTY